MRKFFPALLPALLLFSCEPEQPQTISDRPVPQAIVKTDSSHYRDSLAMADSARKQQEIPPPPQVIPLPPIDPCIDCWGDPEPYTGSLPEPVYDTVRQPLLAEKEIVEFPEIAPSFPGGDTALRSFFRRNTIYPQTAKEMQVEGRVFIQAVVEQDGSLSSLKVLKEIPGGSDLTQEAIRVIRLMPAWIPAQNRGETVRSKIVIPIRFSLE